MLSIVIAIISIALVIALVGSSIYYFGGGINDQNTEAKATKLRNEASQIAAAVQLYRNDGNEFGQNFTLEVLTDMGYLSTLPVDWVPGEDKIMYVLENSDEAEAICFVANRQANFEFDIADTDVVAYSGSESLGIPLCSKANLNPLVPCCTDS